jgi:3-dehydroquinate synthase
MSQTFDSSLLKESLFLYGPSGSGKSTLGPRLAQELNTPFDDLDEIICRQSGKSIPEIFQQEGEAGFRKREKEALKNCLVSGNRVIALGGGALLDSDNRQLAEQHGKIICLTAKIPVLVERLEKTSNVRPLLHNGASLAVQLESLVKKREQHYASFTHQLDTSNLTQEEAVSRVLLLAGMFRISGMGREYDVRVIENGIENLGSLLQIRQLTGPVVVVTDQKVALFYLAPVLASLRQAGYQAEAVVIQEGEKNKNIFTVIEIWEKFLSHGLDRQSTLVALGGGVVSDLAGFAAATYMRGIRWVGVPTTLLAMVDASLGGKTGADLPQGKNLIGAFYPPSLVVADPLVLKTLPERELISGMAEVIKHGIINDPELYSFCKRDWETITQNWNWIVRHAMAVKIKIIQEDPFEKNKRAVLNLGHTIGHAIERQTGYQIAHGEAVSIGINVVSQYAEKIGLAEPGLSQDIKTTLKSVGLPVSFPFKGSENDLIDAMKVDKKKVRGVPHFVLPVRIGEVRWGMPVHDLEPIIDILKKEAE